MCNPAVAMAVVGGLQSGVQFAGARQQAKQQAAAQAQQAAFQAQSAAAERSRFMQEQSSIRMQQAQKQLIVLNQMLRQHIIHKIEWLQQKITMLLH